MIHEGFLLTSTLHINSHSNGNNPNPPQVLLYSRVSSPQQARTGHSIEAQPEALRAYCEAQGWRIISEIADPGKTGKNADREGFNALMEAIKQSRPDAVVVTRLSRLMRNARLTLNAVHEMRELGVALICKDEPIDTRQRGIGDMFLAILATMAEWESDRLSEYSKDTRQRLISKGRWPAGKPPFGFTFNKAAGLLELMAEEAEVVQLIFDLYTSHRVGMGGIRRELALRGILSPQGKAVWGVNVISGILMNEVYAGRHRLGIPAPAIVSPDMFARAKALRASNKTFHPARKDPWPLQNRLRCRMCGSHFRCFYSHGRRWYRCQGRESNSRHYLQTGGKCQAPGLLAKTVELTIYSTLMDALTDPPKFLHILDASIDRLRLQQADLERDAEPLYEGRKRARESLERIERAWLNGILPESELSLRGAKAQEELEYYESRLDAFDRGQLDELENTRNLLSMAERARVKVKANHASKSRIRSLLDVALWPHLPEEGFSSNWTLEVDSDGVPHALGEILNRLRAECFYTHGRIDVQGIVTISVPMECQPSSSSWSARRNRVGRNSAGNYG